MVGISERVKTMDNAPTLPMDPKDRVLWAMWDGKLQAEGLGMRAGRNGKVEAASMPYDDAYHAPVACIHGVAPQSCGICTGQDNYRSVSAVLTARAEARLDKVGMSEGRDTK